jgi:hypothetical protein
MMTAFSSTEEATIDIQDNTVFRVKTHMWWRDKYQYYDTLTDRYGEQDETVNWKIKRYTQQETEINL